MRHPAIIALALLLAPLAAHAQDPTAEEQAVLNEIARCLVAGLPTNWTRAEMTLDLPAPNAETGDVRYVFRRALSGGDYELFRPGNDEGPARPPARPPHSPAP